MAWLMTVEMITCLLEIALCETFAGIKWLFLETYLHALDTLKLHEL